MKSCNYILLTSCDNILRVILISDHSKRNLKTKQVIQMNQFCKQVWRRESKITSAEEKPPVLVTVFKSEQ